MSIGKIEIKKIPAGTAFRECPGRVTGTASARHGYRGGWGQAPLPGRVGLGQGTRAAGTRALLLGRLGWPGAAGPRAGLQGVPALDAGG